MKTSITAILALYIAAVVSCLPLSAEEAKEEKVIPTEVSSPPYQVGNLVTKQGYYIERTEAPSINFRIVENKIRIYWIDEDGLIAEPESQSGTVRFIGSVRGRPYHHAAPLSGEAGLGAPGLILTPHIFNVIISLEGPDGEELDTYSFRYTPEMDKETQPEGLPDASGSSGTEKGSSD